MTQKQRETFVLEKKNVLLLSLNTGLRFSGFQTKDKLAIQSEISTTTTTTTTTNKLY